MLKPQKNTDDAPTVRVTLEVPRDLHETFAHALATSHPAKIAFCSTIEQMMIAILQTGAFNLRRGGGIETVS